MVAISSADTGAGSDGGEAISATSADTDTASGTEAGSVTVLPSVSNDTVQFAESASIFIPGSEPAFSEMTYDMGWKDLVNVLNISVTTRVPDAVVSEIFQSQDFFTVAAGETKSITLQTTDVFYNAITPVQDVDYTLSAGSATVNVALNRDSGQSITITFRPDLGPATIQGFVIRGTLIPVTSTLVITVRDEDSIAVNGEKSVDLDLPWAGVNDVLGIATMIVGKRAFRNPLIKVTLNNQTDERLATILQRKISDQVHIIEPRTYTNDEFYIDTIEHSISSAGLLHKVAFTCEKQITQVTNVFTFDDPLRGFNDGLFGRRGIDQTDSVFRLDVSNLNERLLAH